MNLLNSLSNALTGRKNTPEATPATKETATRTWAIGAVDARSPGQLPKTSEPLPKSPRLFEREYKSGYRPWISPELIQDTANEQGVTLAEGGELTPLRAFHAKDEKLDKLVRENSYEAVRREIWRQVRERRHLLKVGDIEAAEAALESTDHESTFQEAARRKTAWKIERQNIRNEAAPILRRITERAILAFEKAYPELDRKERAVVLKYGWEFTPSPRLVATGQATWVLRETMDASLRGAFTIPAILSVFGIKL